MMHIVDVDMFGPPSIGKTALAKALQSFCDATFGRAIHDDTISSTGGDLSKKAHILAVEQPRPYRYRTTRHAFTHADRGDDVFPHLVRTGERGDLSILVLAASEDLDGRIEPLLRLVSLLEMGPLIVFLNKTDLVDPAVAARWERELPILLASFGYPNPPATIVKGSAMDGSGLAELLRAMEETLRPRPVASSLPLRFRIGEIMPSRDGALLVGGSLDSGVLHVGDPVELVGLGLRQPVVVSGLEQFRRPITAAHSPIRSLVVALDGIAPNAITPGQVLCAPDSLAAHARFTACISLLSEKEGGRPAAMSGGEPLVFRWGPADLKGVARVSPREQAVTMGSISVVDIELPGPVALAKHDTFQLWSLNKRCLACGIVSALP